jgi:hypothetical protein
MPKKSCVGQPQSLNLPSKYAGKWVAVKGSTVVGEGPTIAKALAEAAKKGQTRTKLVLVPNKNEHFLF